MIKRILVFLRKLFNRVMEDNIFGLSAQLSYYLILSIFPFVIFFISILCNYSEYIYIFLESLVTILPIQVYDIIYKLVNYAVNSCSQQYMTISMLVILWSATAASSTIIKVINVAYGFKMEKNYIFLRLRGILFTLALMFSIQIIFVIIIAGRSVLIFVKNLSVFRAFNFIFIDLLRYGLSFLIVFIILIASYKFLPYERIRFSYAVPGAIFSSIGFTLGSYIYSLYVSTKVVYINSIYGNLSGLFVFFIWIYIMSIIFLTGAQVNYLYPQTWGKD